MKEKDIRKYPCADCGILRSENEGGTTFTVCDKCWDKHYKKEPQVDEEGIISDEEIKNQLLKSGFLISYAENLTDEEIIWWRNMCEAQKQADDARCREKIEGIFREIEGYKQSSNDINIQFIFSKDEWQSLISRILEDK